MTNTPTPESPAHRWEVLVLVEETDELRTVTVEAPYAERAATLVAETLPAGHVLCSIGSADEASR